MRGKDKWIIIGIIAFVVFSIIIDYLNILNYNNRYNTEFISMIVTNAVIIILYVITYTKLDRINIERTSNQREIAMWMLAETYISVDNIIKNILTYENVKKFVVPKIDFNKTNLESETNKRIEDNLGNMPFSYDNQILLFLSEGIISKSEICNYMKVKEEYKKFSSVIITFFDAPEIVEPQRTALKNALRKANTELAKGDDRND